MTGPSICDRRFHPLLTDHRRWVRERSHESYAKNYSVVFPHDEPLAGRNMRTDPLHEVPHPDKRGDPRDAQGTGVTEGCAAPQLLGRRGDEGLSPSQGLPSRTGPEPSPTAGGRARERQVRPQV